MLSCSKEKSFLFLIYLLVVFLVSFLALNYVSISNTAAALIENDKDGLTGESSSKEGLEKEKIKEKELQEPKDVEAESNLLDEIKVGILHSEDAAEKVELSKTGEYIFGVQKGDGEFIPYSSLQGENMVTWDERNGSWMLNEKNFSQPREITSKVIFGPWSDKGFMESVKEKIKVKNETFSEYELKISRDQTDNRFYNLNIDPRKSDNNGGYDNETSTSEIQAAYDELKQILAEILKEKGFFEAEKDKEYILWEICSSKEKAVELVQKLDELFGESGLEINAQEEFKITELGKKPGDSSETGEEKFWGLISGDKINFEKYFENVDLEEIIIPKTLNAKLYESREDEESEQEENNEKTGDKTEDLEEVENINVKELKSSILLYKEDNIGVKLTPGCSLEESLQIMDSFREELEDELTYNRSIKARLGVVDRADLENDEKYDDFCVIIDNLNDEYIAGLLLDQIIEKERLDLLEKAKGANEALVYDYSGHHSYEGSSYHLISAEKIDFDKATSLLFKPRPGSDCPIEILNNGSKYRGTIMLKIDEHERLMVINSVELEDYLKGVVPAEVYTSWHKEALKAQAVAARTYALYSRDINKERYEHFDVTDDTDSQVYYGYNEEVEKTNKAVKETRGEVILNDDQLINALYHSNAGGHTEDAENIWGNSIEYLKGVESSWDDAALDIADRAYDWEVEMSFDEVSENINNLYEIGEFKNMQIIERTEGGRVLRVRYEGSDGTHEVFGDFNRTPLNLRSTNFQFKNNKEDSQISILTGDGELESRNQAKGIRILTGESVDKKYLESDKYYVKSSEGMDERSSELIYNFDGKGFGHGAGLSQWGAQGKALEGYDYREILKYYYSGDIEIDKLK